MRLVGVDVLIDPRAADSRPYGVPWKLVGVDVPIDPRAADSRPYRVRWKLVGVDVLIDPRAADSRPYRHAPGPLVGAGFIPARAGVRFAEGLRESPLPTAAA